MRRKIFTLSSTSCSSILGAGGGGGGGETTTGTAAAGDFSLTGSGLDTTGTAVFGVGFGVAVDVDDDMVRRFELNDKRAVVQRIEEVIR